MKLAYVYVSVHESLVISKYRRVDLGCANTEPRVAVQSLLEQLYKTTISTTQLEADDIESRDNEQGATNYRSDSDVTDLSLEFSGEKKS